MLENRYEKIQISFLIMDLMELKQELLIMQALVYVQALQYKNYLILL